MEEFNNLPNSAKKAKELGEKMYYTGKPCKHGHLSPRWAGNSNCVECLRVLVRENKKERWHKNKDNQEYKESVYKYNRAWNKRNKPYHAQYQVKRKATKLQATPSWIDEDLVRDMYLEAEYFQLEVDHIVPLKSDKVCGLHWEGNLQLLSRQNNASKGNYYWPDMWS